MSGTIWGIQSWPDFIQDTRLNQNDPIKQSPYLLNLILLVEQPHNSSSSNQRDPVTFFLPIVIQICLFGKVPSINFPVLWAAFSAFFAGLSTLMLMHSFSVQYCHFFVSLACDCTYLNMTWKGWTETRCLKAWCTSAWNWLVGSEWKGAFPWETTPLLLQSIRTGGIVLWCADSVAFRINCIITPPSISPWYRPKDDKCLAQVNLHVALAIVAIVVIVQYIIVATKQMSGDNYFMYDPSCMIARDCASMPLSIQELFLLLLSNTHKVWLAKCLIVCPNSEMGRVEWALISRNVEGHVPVAKEWCLLNVGSPMCGNVWLLLVSIQSCECKGEGHWWTGNQVFRWLGLRKEWDLWKRSPKTFCGIQNRKFPADD